LHIKGKAVASFIPYRDGPGVARENPRHETWTRGQARARRNALWLSGLEVGFHDPTCNCQRPYSSEEIASLWGLTPRAVRAGIADAVPS
jgi:hypothetical protein